MSQMEKGFWEWKVCPLSKLGQKKRYQLSLTVRLFRSVYQQAKMETQGSYSDFMMVSIFAVPYFISFMTQLDHS